jgi:hypothetical protein
MLSALFLLSKEQLVQGAALFLFNGYLIGRRFIANQLA